MWYYFQGSYQSPFPVLSPGEELRREGEEQGPATASGLGVGGQELTWRSWALALFLALPCCGSVGLFTLRCGRGCQPLSHLARTQFPSSI